MYSPPRRVAVLHLRSKRPSAPGFQDELDMLNDAALASISALGWDPRLVASAEQPAIESLTAAREADMIVLMGGEDVDPRLYSDSPEYPGSGHHESKADSIQIAVVLEALQQRTPFLGICRGTQLLNVALGGTLIQHLPTARNHRAPGHAEDVFQRVQIRLDPELQRDLPSVRTVLCAHHQAIDALGHGLRVVGRSPDGVIEAVVHETAPLTGVQWHPEHPRTAETQLTALLLRMERQLASAPSAA